MKILINVATFADLATFFWFSISSYQQLWNDHFLEASALLVAAVFWQRFEKTAMLDKLTNKPDSKDEP